MLDELILEGLEFGREAHDRDSMHYCMSWQALMHADVQTALRDKPRMAYKEEALAYLRDVISQTGQTATALAKLAGVNQTTFTRPLNNAEHKYAIKFQALQALSERTGIALPAALMAARDAAKAPVPAEVRLPIRYEVAASGFLPREELRQVPYGFRTVPSIAPFADCEQWLERVISDSMDRILPVGSEIHVVNAIQLRYRPQHDDIVVVERTSKDGGFVERTVKQVTLTPEGARLWPRSHNARWQEPIALTKGGKDDEGMTVQIVGLVVRSYQFFGAEPDPADAADAA